MIGLDWEVPPAKIAHLQCPALWQDQVPRLPRKVTLSFFSRFLLQKLSAMFTSPPPAGPCGAHRGFFAIKGPFTCSLHLKPEADKLPPNRNLLNRKSSLAGVSLRDDSDPKN